MIRTLFFAALFGLCFDASGAVGALSFVPSVRTVEVGETFTVAVQGTFDTDVWGGGLILTVPPGSVLGDVEAIFDDDVWDFHSFDAETLRAEFGAMSPVPQGTFTILAYQIQVQAPGTYSLGLEQATPFLSGSEEVITVSLPPCATCSPPLPAGSISVVPEPATVGMLLAGLVVALLRLRRA